VVAGLQAKIWMFSCELPSKVVEMPDSDPKGRLEQSNEVAPLNEDLAANNDLIMEQILENLNTTPIGQVLKNIASLPEIRKQKVLQLRQQITEGRYDLSERLDVALDKVLEDLAT
jgi:hypothetical protein